MATLHDLISWGTALIFFLLAAFAIVWLVGVAYTRRFDVGFLRVAAINPDRAHEPEELVRSSQAFLYRMSLLLYFLSFLLIGFSYLFTSDVFSIGRSTVDGSVVIWGRLAVYVLAYPLALIPVTFVLEHDLFATLYGALVILLFYASFLVSAFLASPTAFLFWGFGSFLLFVALAVYWIPLAEGVYSSPRYGGYFLAFWVFGLLLLQLFRLVVGPAALGLSGYVINTGLAAFIDVVGLGGFFLVLVYFAIPVWETLLGIGQNIVNHGAYSEQLWRDGFRSHQERKARERATKTKSSSVSVIRDGVLLTDGAYSTSASLTAKSSYVVKGSTTHPAHGERPPEYGAKVIRFGKETKIKT